MEGKYLPGRRRTAWIDDARRWTVTEGEIEGKRLPGRRRTAWIDDVRRWTVTEGEIEGNYLPVDGEQRDRRCETMDCYRGRNRGKV